MLPQAKMVCDLWTQCKRAGISIWTCLESSALQLEKIAPEVQWDSLRKRGACR